MPAMCGRVKPSSANQPLRCTTSRWLSAAASTRDDHVTGQRHRVGHLDVLQHLGPTGRLVEHGLHRLIPFNVSTRQTHGRKSALRITQCTPLTVSTTWLTSKSAAALR